jgi:hypothetical protein
MKMNKINLIQFLPYILVIVFVGVFMLNQSKSIQEYSRGQYPSLPISNQNVSYGNTIKPMTKRVLLEKNKGFREELLSLMKDASDMQYDCDVQDHKEGIRGRNEGLERMIERVQNDISKQKKLGCNEYFRMRD